jgi:hypothetical protein
MRRFFVNYLKENGMSEENKKSVYLSVRIRTIDRSLLEILCKRRGLNLSEGIRHSINIAAKEEGFHNVAGVVLESEVKNG